jgi:hypothetical protein
MDRRTEEMRAALLKFLPLIGQGPAVARIKVEAEGEGEYLIEFDDLVIHCGYQVAAPRIGKPDHTHPGYRVFWWKQHPDSRWEPGDVEDITECETINPQAALTAIGTLYAREAAENVISSFNPEY